MSLEFFHFLLVPKSELSSEKEKEGRKEKIHTGNQGQGRPPRPATYTVTQGPALRRTPALGYFFMKHYFYLKKQIMDKLCYSDLGIWLIFS